MSASPAADRRPRAGGFSLVEVLATMALLAIVLPAVMRGLSLCTDAAAHAADQAHAAALAQAKLEEMVATGDWRHAEQSGDFGQDRPGYRWTARAGDWQDDRLRELAVEVAWTRRGQARAATVATLVYTGTPATATTGE